MSEQAGNRDIGAEIQALADAFNVNATIGYIQRDQRWYVGFKPLHLVQYGGALCVNRAENTRRWDVAASSLTRYGASLSEAFDQILAVVDGDKPYMLCNTEMGFMSGGYDDEQPRMTVFEGRTAVDSFDYHFRSESEERVRTFLDTHSPREIPPEKNL